MTRLTPRSFRGRLALQFGVVFAVIALAGAIVGYAALRAFLFQRLDSVVMQLANIEAAATADSEDDQVHFHDEVFLSTGAGHEALLTRFAQVWTTAGAPLIRTRNLGEADLPLPPAILGVTLRTGTAHLFEFRWREASYRSVLYPLGLVDPRHEDHLLQVAVSTADTERLLRRALGFLIGMILVGVCLGGGTGWWLAGNATRPVLDIIQQAEGLGSTDPGHRIAVATDTQELRRLVSVLNGLLSRIDGTLDAQRQFLADAGHAIKTPLTILRGDVEVTLRRSRSPEEYRTVLLQALEDVRLISSLAEDLILLARSDSGKPLERAEDVPLQALFDRLAGRFEGAAARAGQSLAITDPGPLAARGDAILLDRALANLVDNAIKYGRTPGGSIVLSGTLRPDGRVAIAVADDGPGISPEDQPFVEDRFYRAEATRARVRGTGLGLAIVKAIAAQLGGALELASTVGTGTIATLVVPRGSDPRGREPAARS